VLPLAADDKAAKPVPPSLETIKKMAGDWVMVDKDGKLTDQIVSSIRVTAGGSAVVETLFPGGEHEMISMYHQEGPDLYLTHYCVLGNQPRLKAEANAAPGTLVFKCVGGGNLKQDKDVHMGQGVLTFLANGQIKSDWTKCENGKACETHSFTLARKSK
jgi:hypothetical protein